MAPMEDMESAHDNIRHIVASCPLIDNHCHNLVSLDCSLPFKRFLTEADNAALPDGMTAIAFKVIVCNHKKVTSQEEK